MKRREALKSLVVSGAAAALPAGAGTEPTELSEDQLRAMLRLVGMELGAGEGAAVLASFMAIALRRTWIRRSSPRTSMPTLTHDRRHRVCDDRRARRADSQPAALMRGGGARNARSH